MKNHPGRIAEALLCWFPPPDDHEVEVQAAAMVVAYALLGMIKQQPVKV